MTDHLANALAALGDLVDAAPDSAERSAWVERWRIDEATFAQAVAAFAEHAYIAEPNEDGEEWPMGTPIWANLSEGIVAAAGAIDQSVPWASFAKETIVAATQAFNYNQGVEGWEVGLLRALMALRVQDTSEIHPGS